MKVPLKVLIVEDRLSDMELILHYLRQAGYEPDWTQVQTEDQYLANLDPAPDIILADYTLPQFNAPQALNLIKERDIDTPVIVVTGSISEEVAVECMKQGASDYLLKDRLTRLGSAVQRALEEKALHRKSLQAEETQKRLVTILEATTDLVGIADKDGRLSYLNLGGRNMLGIGQGEDLLDLMILEVHPPQARPTVLNQSIPTAIQTGSWQGETVMISREGREIPVSQVILAHRAQDGDVMFLSTIARDITNRQQAEEQIHRQVERLRALRAIDLAITNSLDSNLTFGVLLDQVTSSLGVDAADILLFDADSQMLNYAAGRGFRSISPQHMHLRPGESHANLAIFERKLISIPDLNRDEASLSLSTLLKKEGFVSYFAIPLYSKGQIKGVMELYQRSRFDPTPEWIEFVEALASQASIAIENASLFSDLQRFNMELSMAYDATLEGWARALELRDLETEGHTRRVTELTLRLARRMGFSGEELLKIRRGALLHDIGKMGIPDSILLKQGPLTEEEWQVMRRHPIFAYEMLTPIRYLSQAIDIPYCHHEKWDGSGYPRGLKGETIPLVARIFAVADVWDALTSDRPYRQAWPKEKTLAYIREQSGKHFEPRIVEVFFEEITQFPTNE